MTNRLTALLVLLISPLLFCKAWLSTWPELFGESHRTAIKQFKDGWND